VHEQQQSHTTTQTSWKPVLPSFTAIVEVFKMKDVGKNYHVASVELTLVL
jgi:hypothetical protein